MTDQPTGVPPHFIVLVPGYMGSRLRDRKTGQIVWLDVPALLDKPFELGQSLENLFTRMKYPNDDLEPAGIIDQIVFVPPLFKQEHYNRLLTALGDMGYDLKGGPGCTGPAVYTFAYDWRQDNRISARQLGQAILRWEQNHPGAKAWLIGHSNGGIVSRWYIEKEGGKEHVERLFLMGSPWDGAPKTMQVLLKGLDMFLMRLFGHYVDIQKLTREAILSFPSFYQIVPSRAPFLRDHGGYPVDPYTQTGWLDNERQRQMMLEARSFNEELGTTLSVETLCFFGVKLPTATTGIVRIAPGGQWQDVEWEYTDLGDGTVPQRSAVHPMAKEKLPFVANHGDIYIIPPVLEKLEWELVGKYRQGVLAEAITSTLKIRFKPDQDFYEPGQAIRAWAILEDQQSGAPVYGAQITMHLKWQQSLRGGESAPLGQASEALVKKSVLMVESTQSAGHYEGSLAAPDTPGYYRLVASVEVEGQPPVLLEELLLVEPDQPYLDQKTPPGSPDDKSFMGFENSSYESGTDDQIMRSWQPSPKTPPEEEVVYRSFEQAGQAPPIAKGLQDEWGAKGITPDESPQPLQGYFPGAEPAAPAANTAAASGERFLTVEVTDREQQQPLPLNQEATLAFFIDVQKSDQGVKFDETRLFQQDEQAVQLLVALTSQDFIVHTKTPQPLRVPRSGPSRNKARFDIEPKSNLPGTGEVTALVYKDNNFIQDMTVRLSVGQGESAIQSVESLGRPLDGASLLQPRDVLLFIKKTVAGFDLTLVAGGVTEASLPITSQQLQQRIFQARQALLDVVFLTDGPQGVYVHPRDRAPAANVNLYYQTGVDIPNNIYQESLKRLARAGWMLYQDLFYGPAARPDARELGDRLRELAEQNRPLKLQIVSQEFFMPWGLLYLAQRVDPNQIQPERFLGLKHIVEHIPLQTRMRAAETCISSQPHLTISLNVNDDIDRQMGLTVVKQQLEYWQKIKQGGKVDVIERHSDQELLNAFGSANTPEQILYFYGHAISKQLDETSGPDTSSLGFAGSRNVALGDLKFYAPLDQLLAQQPLVFINACESAELSPLFYDGFMPYFTAKGARGMIGTECQVPARFAAEWAQRFFDRFLYEEKPLGSIFLELRKQFYVQNNNLLGLLYALYCDGDTRIEPGLR